MAPIIDCPSCGRKLRLTESQQDQKVRCPSCATIFDAAVVRSPAQAEAPSPPAAEEPVPEPDALHWGHGYSEISSEQSEPAAIPRRESLPANPDGQMVCCPSCGQDTPRRMARCQGCGKALTVEDDYRPWEDGAERQQRLDCEPHRANTVLWLGILGFLPILGIVFGIAAWVMGQRDLRKMARKEMDVRGRGTTQAGWICGIISTAMQALIYLGCGGCFGMIVWSSISASSSVRTAPRPVSRPPQTAAVPVQPQQPR